MGIEKSEWKYLVYAVLFSLVWFLFVIPQVSKTLSGPFQFIILNLGFIIITLFVLKCLSVNVHFNLKDSLAVLLFAIAWAIGSVPLMVGFNGQLLSGPTAYTAAADYNVALLWQSFGITGNLLYIFTYVISPLILIFIASLLIKNSVKRT
jgi:hypothetical protein